MHQLFKYAVTAILTFEARLLLRRKRPKIIGITGSVGKTTTKDAIYTVLKTKVHVRKSEKSFNSNIGVALTVLGLQNAWNSPLLWLKNIFDGALQALFTREYPEVLVLELGVDRPGDMKTLTGFIKPDIVVLTRLPDMPSHVEFFNSPEDVREEKLQLVRALKPDGVFIYNNDDERIRQHTEEVRQPSFGYSRYSPTHFHAVGDKVMYDGGFASGVEFTVKHLDEEVKVRLQGVLGVQHAYNVVAAMAVGYQFGVTLAEAAAAFKDFSPVPGRMRLIAGRNKTLLIDDTYNSSPVAAERAIQTLSELSVPKRKVAILGDMLELGRYSMREHERIGAEVGDAVDVLITVGLRSRKTAIAALNHGLSEKFVFQYDNVEALLAEINTLIHPEDTILVKGSQSVRAERIVKALMLNPEKAPDLLVRQDEVWLNKA